MVALGGHWEDRCGSRKTVRSIPESTEGHVAIRRCPVGAPSTGPGQVGSPGEALLEEGTSGPLACRRSGSLGVRSRRAGRVA